MSKKKKTVLAGAVLAAVILVLIFLLFLLPFRSNALRHSDFRRISSETYDTVFLSMYPIDNYSESDFSYYRGMTVLKADYAVKNISEIRQYLKRIAASGNHVSAVYLGVRPDRLSASQLSSLVQDYPSLTFEIILSYPSAAWWKDLPEKECIRILDEYRTFLSEAAGFSGARFYFFAAEEWLIANPALYEGEFLVDANASSVIFTNSDFLHAFMVTPENADLRGDSLAQLVDVLRSSAAWPDLSDTDIVFFGDSIFGNYSDDMSIPGVVRALTGAAVYNCGYGGNSAAMAADIPISLPGIVSAFFQKDLSLIPENKQTWQGFQEYFNASHSDRKTCFLINYGLNDYLKGYPISSEDPMDIATYTGAIRTAVAELKEKSADSQIILCTPTWSAYVLRESEDPCAPHLQAYADAVLSLAGELDVDVLDFFYTLGINADNYQNYLPDLIHPDEKGRFLIAARKIIPAIR